MRRLQEGRSLPAWSKGKVCGMEGGRSSVDVGKRGRGNRGSLKLWSGWGAAQWEG